MRARAAVSSLAVAAILNGCGAGTVAPAAPSSPLKAITVSHNVDATVAALRAAYAAQDWPRIHRLIPNRPVADQLIGKMQAWIRSGAADVRVTPVLKRHVGRYRAVVTLDFSDDPRAWPAYLISLMNTKPDPARIIATVTGLHGTNVRNTTWTVTRAPHFILYHSPYQIVGSDRVYLHDLEVQRSTFARKFGVHLPPLAAYYLYPTKAAMSRVSGGSCGSEPGNVGCTTPFSSPPTIQTVLWPTYHEPIHVYEVALEPQATSRAVWYAPLFISEGAAVALEDRHVDPRLSDYCSYNLVYVPLDVCARVAIKHVHPLRLLRDRGFERVTAGYAYSLAGSFVKYLILRYGYHRFGHFYYRLASQPSDRERDYDAAAKKVYGRSVRALLGAWERQLA